MIEWTDKIMTWDYGKKLAIKPRKRKSDPRLDAIISVLSFYAIASDDPLEQIAKEILDELAKIPHSQVRKRATG